MQRSPVRFSRLPRLSALILCVCALLVGAPGTLADAPRPADSGAGADAWAALAEGRAVIMMRHALAPGTGDPADFDPQDCATQRNLSDTGRQQARRIGTALRARLAAASAAGRAIDPATVEVFSSTWCRCLETAELLALGPVERLASLDSFFVDRSSGPRQTDASRDWIRTRLAGQGAAPAVLVTHQVNITALTGVYPASGELVIIDALGEPMLTVRLAAI